MWNGEEFEILEQKMYSVFHLEAKRFRKTEESKRQAMINYDRYALKTSCLHTQIISGCFKTVHELQPRHACCLGQNMPLNNFL